MKEEFDIASLHDYVANPDKYEGKNNIGRTISVCFSVLGELDTGHFDKIVAVVETIKKINPFVKQLLKVNEQYGLEDLKVKDKTHLTCKDKEVIVMSKRQLNNGLGHELGEYIYFEDF